MESSTPRRTTASDFGTLWTMRRPGQSARCALIARPQGWELHVMIDRRLVLAERCERGGDAFTIAASIKDQMLCEGWLPIVPHDPSPGLVTGTKARRIRRR